MHNLLWSEIMIQVAMVEEGDEDEQFKAVMDEAKQAIQVSSNPTCHLYKVQVGSENWFLEVTLLLHVKRFDFRYQEASSSGDGGPDNSSEEIVVEYNHNDYADLIGKIFVVVAVVLLLIFTTLISIKLDLKFVQDMGPDYKIITNTKNNDKNNIK